MTSSANIVFLIDLQNGFARNDFTSEQGGSLYVPGGEQAGEPAARLIRNSRDTIFILSQDYHPPDQIGFASNHSGVQPFSNIYLRCDGPQSRYRAIGAEIDGKVRAVTADEKGYITGVGNRELSPGDIRSTVKQTLWLTHCVQGTESALFVDPIMGELPHALAERLRRHDHSPVLSAGDERGNTFYVIRKGMRSDLDSYGIATENDRVSTTGAGAVFGEVTGRLKKEGTERADISIGGLATNYCDEFSHADIQNLFTPLLIWRGIKTRVHFLTDISHGIPIDVPGGAWPDLGNALNRITARGTDTCTTDDLIRGGLDRKSGEPCVRKFSHGG